MLEARDISLKLSGTSVLSSVNLSVHAGEIVGLDGASGAGKTSLGRILAGITQPDRGSVRSDGRVQYLHQNPSAALNPRWRIARSLSEAGAFDTAVAASLGVAGTWLHRYPHELSGGQLQRVSVLRALFAKPRYLIADEISASLDAVSQVRIWQALRRLVAQQGIGILAISHDEALLSRISNRLLTLENATIFKVGSDP